MNGSVAPCRIKAVRWEAERSMKDSKRRLIYLAVYLAYTSIYISRINLSVANPSLTDLGVFDAAGYGVIGGLFSTIYAVGRLVNGAFSDKAPPWLMLSVGLGFAGLSNILIGFLPTYMAILLLWSVNAYAQSMLWSSVLATVSGIYDERRRKSRASLMVTAVATGNVAAILLGAWLITKLGVEFAFIVPGALNIVLGLAVALLTRRIPAGESGAKSSHISILSLFSRRDMLVMCAVSVLHGIMKENVGVWMVAYVSSEFGVDLSESSYYILLIPLIGLAARLVYPFALRACREKENRVSIIGFLICTAASVLLLFPTLGIGAAVPALGLVYASTSMVNTSITTIYPMSYLKTGNVASVSGVLDFASYFGAGISGMVYGVVINEFGYAPMYVSWVAFSVISILLLMIVNKMRKAEQR